MTTLSMSLADSPTKTERIFEKCEGISQADLERTGMDKLISIGRAARMLGVSITTLRKHANTKDVPSVRSVGGHRRFKLSDIEKMQDALDPILAHVQVTDPKILGKLADYCNFEDGELESSLIYGGVRFWWMK